MSHHDRAPSPKSGRGLGSRRPRPARGIQRSATAQDRARLPLRWAVIMIASGIAAGVANQAGGPVAAMTAGAAIFTALSRTL